MKFFGLLVPTLRKGTYVIVSDPSCARGATAEKILKHLDPKDKYKKSFYVPPKRGSKGIIVSLIKYSEPNGASLIYYGVLVKDILYAFPEEKLAKA